MSEITPCPGCGNRSAEDYDGLGSCWTCHSKTFGEPGPTVEPLTDDWLDGAPMDPVAVPAEPVPAIPGIPFGIPGTMAIVVGPTGGGRSAAIQAALADAARAGLRGLYVGHEVDEPEFNARSASLAHARGWKVDDELRTALARVRYVDLITTLSRAWVHPESWVTGIVARYDIVAIDPLSAVDSATGLNLESNPDYLKVHDTLFQPLTSKGVFVIAADNIGHAFEAKNRAKGASAKQDRADFVFACSSVAAPPGLILRAMKVRSVRSPIKRGDEWVIYRDKQQFETHAASSDTPADSFKPTVLMERVSKELEQAAEPLSKSEIRRRVSGRNEYIDKALDALVSDGNVNKTDAGYVSVNVYRSPEPCPDPAPNDLPTLPTLPQPAPHPAPAAPGDPAHPAFLKGQGGRVDHSPHETDEDLLARAEEIIARYGDAA